MMYQNIDLYKNVKSYVEAAIQHLQKSDVEAYLFSLQTSRFVFQGRELEVLSEYKECLLTFKKYPEIMCQFNQLTGVGIAASRSVTLETFMLHIPQLLGIHSELLEFNETFYSNDIKFDVIVPLQGPRFSGSIKLEENLEICLVSSKDLRPINDKEITDNAEAQPSVETCWAIRTSYSLPKLLGEDVESQERKTQDDVNNKKRESANELVELVVIVLRLFSYLVCRFSSIYPVTMLHQARSLLYPQKKPFRIRYFPDFTITWGYDENFTKSFPEFWRTFRMKGVSDRKFIEVAAKRFSFAHERYNWEDKIVDLLIAAEALFLCDHDGKSELRYRLSLRAACFLADDQESRKQIFTDFKTAYDLRSKIVHGVGAERDIYRISESEQYGMDGFVSKIQWYICCAICKAIRISNEPHTPKYLVDWDTLIFNAI